MAITWIGGLPPAWDSGAIIDVRPEFHEGVGRAYEFGALDAHERLPAGATYRFESIDYGFSMLITYWREQ